MTDGRTLYYALSWTIRVNLVIITVRWSTPLSFHLSFIICLKFHATFGVYENRHMRVNIMKLTINMFKYVTLKYCFKVNDVF